jgi:hypothetical protein
MKKFILLMFGGCLISILCECRRQESREFSCDWEQIESPTDKDLYSVFALSEDNA